MIEEGYILSFNSKYGIIILMNQKDKYIMPPAKIKNTTVFYKETIPKEGARPPHSLSPTPQRQKFINIAEKLMTVIGASGQILFYLQAYKIYSVGSANDVSTPGFCFSLFSLVCWLLYGLLIKNKVLIIVNIFAVIGAALTLLAIFWVS